MLNFIFKYACFNRLSTLTIGIFLATTGCASAQTTMDAPVKTQKVLTERYHKIIAKATTERGLLDIHRVDEKLYFEIPDSLLGRDMLLVGRVAKVPEELGSDFNAGRKLTEQMIRWNRMDNRILLKPVSTASIAADSLHIAASVEANTFTPVLAIFDIVASNPDKETVMIEVSGLFTEDIFGIPTDVRDDWEISGLEKDRSFINFVHTYPQNVEVRHTLTFRSTSDAALDWGVFSVRMNQSIVLLPKQPMTPHPCDMRVGYFDVKHINYGSDKLEAAEECFITRWKLIPSDMEAYQRGELVEPIDPIVFYVGREVPNRWRSYVKQGIEEWNEAFNEAGFKNAIIAKEAPTKEENPDWSAEDACNSTIRWVASTHRGAEGPRVVDPRTGQIIESDIFWFHNHLRSYRNRLIIETGAANPNARTLELSDNQIGEVMQQVIAHEVGHALGLLHNMIASSAYSVDSLRSPSFTKKYGLASSIMDFARQNYVAQPGDGMKRFIRKTGPYDLYAIGWGYRRFPNLSLEEREKRLNKIILDHAGDPKYRFFSGSPNGADPRAQTEDLGDDHVAASTLGIKNLERVVPNLIKWTTNPGETYDALDEIYTMVQGMWDQYVGDVINVVGGIYTDHKTIEQPGPVYTPVPRDKQGRAVRFLAEYAFDPPVWLMDKKILDLVSQRGGVYWMQYLQMRALKNLLSPKRLERMGRIETRWPQQAYPISVFMDEVQHSIWSELDSSQPKIGIYRRNLQRGYIDHMKSLLRENETEENQIRPILKKHLEALEESIRDNISNAVNETTRIHLQMMADQI